MLYCFKGLHFLIKRPLKLISTLIVAHTLAILNLVTHADKPPDAPVTHRFAELRAQTRETAVHQLMETSPNTEAQPQAWRSGKLRLVAGDPWAASHWNAVMKNTAYAEEAQAAAPCIRLHALPVLQFHTSNSLKLKCSKT